GLFRGLSITLALNSTIVFTCAQIPRSSSPWFLLLPFLGYAAIVAGSVLIWWRRRQGKMQNRVLTHFHPLLLGALGLPGLVCGIFPDWRPACLLCAFLGLAVFEGSRLVYGYAGYVAYVGHRV